MIKGEAVWKEFDQLKKAYTKKVPLLQLGSRQLTSNNPDVQAMKARRTQSVAIAIEVSGTGSGCTRSSTFFCISEAVCSQNT